MKRILMVTVLTLASLNCSLVHSEIFTWTGDDGAVNYTDDTAKIPKNKRAKVTTMVVENTKEAPNIIGQWWNGRSGFSSFGYYFADKGRGFYLTGVSKIQPEKVPTKGSDFSWTIDSDGNIIITPPSISKKPILQGRYFSKTQEICIYEEDNKDCSMTFKPAWNYPSLQ